MYACESCLYVCVCVCVCVCGRARARARLQLMKASGKKGKAGRVVAVRSSWRGVRCALTASDRRDLPPLARLSLWLRESFLLIRCAYLVAAVRDSALERGDATQARAIRFLASIFDDTPNPANGGRCVVASMRAVVARSNAGRQARGSA